MAEKHKIYSAGGGKWKDYMYAMWDFVHNQQSGIVRFVDDGGTKSVYLGGAFWDGSAVLTAASFVDGSYIVVEPVTAYPGGGRWQVRFTCVDHDDTNVYDFTAKMSFSGGWDSTTNVDFASVATAVTDAENVMKDSVNAADSIYISCSDSDTYTNGAGSQKYTYFRFLNWDQSQTDDAKKFQGAYTGGYVPADVNGDTKPSVLMCRYATVLNTGYSWGERTATEDYCLLPGDYAHTSGAGVNAGFAGTGDTTGVPYYSHSKLGQWVNAPCLLTDETAQAVMGSFGKYTMLHGHEGRASGATDSALEYMVSGALMLRWKPSA
jgi:hypothetical protein